MEKKSIMDIPIYPSDVLDNDRLMPDRSFKDAYLDQKREKAFFAENGKTLLNRLLYSLDLTQNDEIAILTTSGDTYVSTCVSVTAFNYAGIRRVVTERTRVAIIIHEFGYIFRDFPQFCRKLQERGIYVIEDCAHIYGTQIQKGRSIGSYGDFAIFSLPKIFPLKKGGMLWINNLQEQNFFNAIRSVCENYEAEEIARQFDSVSSMWKSLNKRRIRRHAILHKIIGPEKICQIKQGDIPWMVYLIKARVPNSLMSRIEFGATLRDDLYLIPTNPLVREEVFVEVANLIAYESGIVL